MVVEINEDAAFIYLTVTLIHLTNISGIPGDLPVVFSLAKYRDSAWWATYFLCLESKLVSRESSAIGDSSKNSMVGSS